MPDDIWKCWYRGVTWYTKGDFCLLSEGEVIAESCTEKISDQQSENRYQLDLFIWFRSSVQLTIT